MRDLHLPMVVKIQLGQGQQDETYYLPQGGCEIGTRSTSELEVKCPTTKRTTTRWRDTCSGDFIYYSHVRWILFPFISTINWTSASPRGISDKSPRMQSIVHSMITIALLTAPFKFPFVNVFESFAPVPVCFHFLQNVDHLLNAQGLVSRYPPETKPRLYVNKMYLNSLLVNDNI